MKNKLNLKSGMIVKADIIDKTANARNVNYLLSIDEQEYKHFWLVDLDTFFVFDFCGKDDVDISDEILEFFEEVGEQLASFNDNLEIVLRRNDI